MTSLNIAVIGSGISGLSAAWLLGKAHRVTLFEAEDRLGGHTNSVPITVDGKDHVVDTGFICFNEATYPNLIAMLAHLGVETQPTTMSFAASMGGGAYEYAGGTWLGMVGQPSNILRADHWLLIRDILRFFKSAPAQVEAIPAGLSIGDWVLREAYSQVFIDRHLLPMAAAIWSGRVGDMMNYPARAFMRFFANHGLLKMYGRPGWRSIAGGSGQYIERMLSDSTIQVRRDAAVKKVVRDGASATVHLRDGTTAAFDQVVIATHADQALAMLENPSAEERSLLGAFDYSSNTAVLHTDRSLMPKHKLTWASWNYLDWNTKSGQPADDCDLCVTYWMNRLQNIKSTSDILVTLNPPEDHPIKNELGRYSYSHPIFDAAALTAQEQLWSLQGENRTWFCGAHFGAGFHEDGLQSGLAVAEQLGNVRRPWDVVNESGRISITHPAAGLMAAQ